MFVLRGSSSPQVLFCVVVEDGFLRPAGGEEGLADELLDVGGDGTAAAVVLIVALEGEETDEAAFDGALQVVRHVVVHTLQAEGHADGFVGTELRTLRSLHLWIAEMDGGNCRIMFRNIVLQDAAQTMFADGTLQALADGCFCRYFSECLFSRWNCIFGVL